MDSCDAQSATQQSGRTGYQHAHVQFLRLGKLGAALARSSVRRRFEYISELMIACREQ